MGVLRHWCLLTASSGMALTGPVGLSQDARKADECSLIATQRHNLYRPSGQAALASLDGCTTADGRVGRRRHERPNSLRLRRRSMRSGGSERSSPSRIAVGAVWVIQWARSGPTNASTASAAAAMVVTALHDAARCPSEA